MRTLRLIGYTLAVLVACFALYVAADVARSFYGAYQAKQSLTRIPPNEIRVEDLRLLPKLPGNYRLRAQIHNLSPTYTLYAVRVSSSSTTALWVSVTCRRRGWPTSLARHRPINRRHSSPKN